MTCRAYRLIFLLVFGLAGLSASGGQAAQNKPQPGVLGKDDRKIVANTDPAFNAIGHINVTSFSKKRRCTGTLIAPDRVVTSAHCVVDALGNPRPAGHIHFVAGVHRGEYLGHAKAKCVHLAKTPYTHVRTFAPELINDIALVVLAKQLDIPPLSLAREISDPNNISLSHPSYPRDSRYALFAHSDCRLRGRKHGLWLTDCDTTPASSGGPLLVSTGTKFQLGAVMSGFVPGKFTVAVPVSRWTGLLQKQTCPNS